jgi:hypothetical protein
MAAEGSAGKGIGYIILLLIIGYVALRYYQVQLTVSKKVQNSQSAAAGVSFYCCQPGTHRSQQLWAFGQANPCQSTTFGFSPAFGPQENQPQPVFNVEI